MKREGLASVDDPGPAGQAPHTGRIGRQRGEFVVDRGDFILNRVVALSFDGPPQFLKDPLRGVEFGRASRLLDQGEPHLPQHVRAMPAGAIPDHGLDAGRAPVAHRGRQAHAFHILGPCPGHPSLLAIDGEDHIAPHPPELHALAELDPARCPAAPHLAQQPHAHLIAKEERRRLAQSPLDESGGESPFFHASCTGGDVVMDWGRGTFGFQRNRASRL